MNEKETRNLVLIIFFFMTEFMLIVMSILTNFSLIYFIGVGFHKPFHAIGIASIFTIYSTLMWAYFMSLLMKKEKGGKDGKTIQKRG